MFSRPARTKSMRFSRVRYSSQHPPVTCLEEDCSISMSREGCQLLISGGTSQSSQNSGSARGKIFQSWSLSLSVGGHKPQSLPQHFLSYFLDVAAIWNIWKESMLGGAGGSRWVIISPSLPWRGLTSGLLITKMWLAVWGVFLCPRSPTLSVSEM